LPIFDKSPDTIDTLNPESIRDSVIPLSEFSTPPIEG